MNNHERYDFNKKNGLFFTPPIEEDIIRELVVRLIESLYLPKEYSEDTPSEFYPDWFRIEKMGINAKEPINWGDLGCSVEKKIDYFSVIIEEAAPDECPTLCEYIEKYLKSWGWNVQVLTEW